MLYWRTNERYVKLLWNQICRHKNNSDEFGYNEKYDVNKDLLNYFKNSNNQLIGQVKDLNEILSGMVKLLQLSWQYKQ